MCVFLCSVNKIYHSRNAPETGSVIYCVLKCTESQRLKPPLDAQCDIVLPRVFGFTQGPLFRALRLPELFHSVTLPLVCAAQSHVSSQTAQGVSEGIGVRSGPENRLSTALIP